MNHKWVKNKDFVPEFGHYEEYKCSVCGMVKTKYHIYGYFGITMSRGERFFSEGQESSCIDWNDNTLD